jgi:glycine/sarcosine N-methyltransferase
MPFYDSIAGYYDQIFPLDRRQINFIEESISGPHQGRRILDVGCGTGDLALALGDLGFIVTAIDADAAMIERAREKASTTSSVVFEQVDMRNLTDAFAPASFDLVLCFGNTLVHLTDPRDMESFLFQVRQVLGMKGKLLLQILNYDYVIDHPIRKLPLIENDVIRFERIYGYDQSHNLLSFRTTLTIKGINRAINNAIPLYPLRRQELEALLRKTGFTDLAYYGDFDRAPSREDSLPLVVEAVKPKGDLVGYRDWC